MMPLVVKILHKILLHKLLHKNLSFTWTHSSDWGDRHIQVIFKSCATKPTQCL